MATINISFDTLSKDMALTLDGTAVADVVGVEIYPSYEGDGDDYCVRISTAQKDEGSGITTMTRLHAGLVPAGATPSAAHAGFAEVRGDTSGSKLHADIAAFCGV